MADGVFVERWKVFLASPGDVGGERAIVRDLLQNALPGDPHIRGRLTFELVSWDDPHQGTPMPAHLTPQEAVTRFHGAPAACQLVIVILWSRLGTHLDVSRECKPDGTPYLSGTEWEYLNAFNASPRPEILVYRRADPPQANLDDPDLPEKQRQRQLVTRFFERFTNPDGSARGGYQPYQGVDGFKHKFTADLHKLVAEHLASRSASVSATALPSAPEPTPVLPPARCLGRDAEADALVAELTQSAPAALLVLGPAGIGKTTLTRRVATAPAVNAHFGQRRYFVALETITDPTTLPAAIIQAAGMNPAGTSLQNALAALAQRPTLLVLDNLETPWEADQRATQDTLLALATTPNVSLLASLRGGAAPAAPRWTAHPTRLLPLSDADARRLFLDLAPQAEADPEHLARFIAALGGVPLAIELVAYRASVDTSLVELWAEWRRRGIELVENPEQHPGRLTSLSGSLDLSWASRRLRKPGRHLFRLLGVLPAGMAREDRTDLLGDDAGEAARQLLAIGLAVSADGRLDLLPPVRDWALSVHPPEGEAKALWCRHYLRLARETGGRIFKSEGASALVRLAPEVANIEAALAAATGLSLREEAVAAMDGVSRLLSASGAGSLTPLGALAATCRAAGDPRSEAWLYFCTAIITLHRSDHAAARAAFEQALPLYRQVSDVLGQANCIRRLGELALARSEHAAARAAYEQALPLYRQVGDVLGEANCIQSLGDIALRRSDHAAARAAFEQALPLYRQIGDVRGEGNCIKGLGDIALRRSEHAAARAAFEQARPLYRKVGDMLGEANCIRSLGDIALRRSEHAAARAAFEQARPLYRQVGSVLGEANCIRSLGDIALRRSEHAAARAAYEQARPLYRQVGDVLGEAGCIQRLGEIALARSDHAAARAAFEQALPLYRQVGSVLGEANCIRSLGDIALRRSEHAAARAAFEQALPLYRQIGDVRGEGNCRLGLGRLAREAGKPDAAREHALAALSLYQSVHAADNIALAREDLARVTAGDERAEHVQAARAAWSAIDLPDQIARLEREFG